MAKFWCRESPIASIDLAVRLDHGKLLIEEVEIADLEREGDTFSLRAVNDANILFLGGKFHHPISPSEEQRARNK